MPPADRSALLAGRDAAIPDSIANLVVSDSGDLGDPRVDQVRIAVQRRILAERIGARVDAGQLMQPVPLELGFCSPQLLLGRPIGEQLIDQLQPFPARALPAARHREPVHS